MRKVYLKVLLIGAVVLLMAGCANVQLNNGQLLVAEIAAQRVGYYVGKNNPDIIPHAKLIAEGILLNEEQDILRGALLFGAQQLSKEFNDPLLEADVKVIADHLQINMPESKIDIAHVKVIVAAFIRGLEVSEKVK